MRAAVRMGGAWSLTSFTDTGADICIYFPLDRSTHSHRGGGGGAMKNKIKKKLKVVMVATPVTGNLSFLLLLTSFFLMLISLPYRF